LWFRAITVAQRLPKPADTQPRIHDSTFSIFLLAIWVCKQSSCRRNVTGNLSLPSDFQQLGFSGDAHTQTPPQIRSRSEKLFHGRRPFIICLKSRKTWIHSIYRLGILSRRSHSRVKTVSTHHEALFLLARRGCCAFPQREMTKTSIENQLFSPSAEPTGPSFRHGSACR
jgi:hypothetical protein